MEKFNKLRKMAIAAGVAVAFVVGAGSISVKKAEEK